MPLFTPTHGFAAVPRPAPYDAMAAASVRLAPTTPLLATLTFVKDASGVRPEVRRAGEATWRIPIRPLTAGEEVAILTWSTLPPDSAGALGLFVVQHGLILNDMSIEPHAPANLVRGLEAAGSVYVLRLRAQGDQLAVRSVPIQAIVSIESVVAWMQRDD